MVRRVDTGEIVHTIDRPRGFSRGKLCSALTEKRLPRSTPAAPMLNCESGTLETGQEMAKKAFGEVSAM